MIGCRHRGPTRPVSSARQRRTASPKRYMKPIAAMTPAASTRGPCARRGSSRARSAFRPAGGRRAPRPARPRRGGQKAAGWRSAGRAPRIDHRVEIDKGFAAMLGRRRRPCAPGRGRRRRPAPSRSASAATAPAWRAAMPPEPSRPTRSGHATRPNSSIACSRPGSPLSSRANSAGASSKGATWVISGSRSARPRAAADGRLPQPRLGPAIAGFRGDAGDLRADQLDAVVVEFLAQPQPATSPWKKPIATTREE